MKRIKKLSVLFLIVIIAIACNSSDDSGNNGDGYDRTALLAFTADHIIIPAVEDFQTKVNTLKTDVETFTTTPNQVNLDAVSASWLNAYKVWQHIEMFNIGPAEEINDYYFFINTYPASVEDISSAVMGNYNLEISNFHDAQGLPALDYLLHADNALDFYTTNANAQGYKDFLTVLVNRMGILTDNVVDNWNAVYRNNFISNTENSGTGSLNKLVSDFTFYYEKGFRANKFGSPAGVFDGFANANEVEAYYKKDVSKELALEALTAIENLFNGRAYGTTTTGESLKTYLEFLNNSELVSAINSRFSTIRSTINNLDADFSEIVESNNSEMLSTYDIIQAGTVLIKTDMAQQSFGMTIDYNDGDND